MAAKILRYQDLDFESFGQASVYVDACFLLAFLNENGEDAGELVENVLIKMQKDGVKNILISNHVFSEVVHHLYLGHFYNVIYTAYRKYSLKHTLTPEEELLLGKQGVAQKLMRLVEPYKLQKMHHEEEVFLPIKELIKSYKESNADRDSLNSYYVFVVQRFNTLCHSLDNYFNIQVQHVPSDEDTFYIAQEFMNTYQLEVKDALHLAAAKQHGATYFATLDSDFVHRLYEDDLGETSIFHISRRYI